MIVTVNVWAVGKQGRQACLEGLGVGGLYDVPQHEHGALDAPHSASPAALDAQLSQLLGHL